MPADQNTRRIGWLTLASIGIGGAIWTTVKISNEPAPAVAQTSPFILYVDASADGGGPFDGHDWENAYKTLAGAIVHAQSQSSVDEIWVAEGTYRGVVELVPNVAIYGGFRGGESILELRDPRQVCTVLSGDVNGDAPTAGFNSTAGERVVIVPPESANATLDGFYIRHGKSQTGSSATMLETSGSALRSRASGLTVRNCTFEWSDSQRDGVVYLDGTNNTISDCIFRHGIAYRGAGVFLASGDVTISGCQFESNAAVDSGGAIATNAGVAVEINGTSFEQNSAGTEGGAMYMDGTLAVENCTFVSNDVTGASGRGGAIFMASGSCTMAGCTIYDNRAPDAGGGFFAAAGNVSVVNTIAWGNRDSYDATTAPPTWSNSESAQLSSNISRSYSCVENGSTTCTGCLAVDPEFRSAPFDMRLSTGSPGIDSGDSASVSAATDLDGRERILGPAVDLGAYESGHVLFVDHAAMGASDGTTWENAFTSLDHALAAALDGTEIWVATGFYVPSVLPVPGDARSANFELIEGVGLYGGFCGDEERLDQRDRDLCPTFLTCDIAGDDTGEHADPSRSENCYNVLTSTDVGQGTALDGFTITGATSSSTEPSGAIRVNSGVPAISNCNFEDNVGHLGAAIHIASGTPLIRQSKFFHNHATGFGGAVFNDSASQPLITDCEMTQNDAESRGGAVYNGVSADLRVVNTMINGNTAAIQGGGVYGIFPGSLEFVNCTFTGNTTSGLGSTGGAVHSRADLTLTNCTIVANEADANGTGIGGGVYVEADTAITNTILWNNADSGTSVSDSQVHIASGATVITYSCVQDENEDDQSVYGGNVTNVDDDPLFLGVPDPGQDGIWASVDDDYGDLRLGLPRTVFGTGGYDSKLENIGDSSIVTTNSDIQGHDRIVECCVDIGAYEFSRTHCHNYEVWESKFNNGGFPTQISPTIPFGPGDFPPRSTDINRSSSPLVSGEARHFRGYSQDVERATHHDVVDLITGRALVQETDFTLDFGSAKFRHIRTFSENFAAHAEGGAQGATVSEYTHNDWNGEHWMMSEAPVLLIDGHFPYINYTGPRRCYFIPDAHHAIPFIFDVNQDAYIAPSSFDAQLGHNGVLSSGDWIERPTEFYVWMHNRSVKYTIKSDYTPVFIPAIDHDINSGICDAEWDPGTIHAQVCGGNENTQLERDHSPYEPWGTPFLGFVSLIEDRYGNRVEYEYCESRRFDCVSGVCDPAQCLNHFEQPTECSTCVAKGQIKNIKLREAPVDGSPRGRVVWTLAYTHREFIYNDNFPFLQFEWLRKLHSIHVYEGEPELPQECLTIGAKYFGAVDMLLESDLIDSTDSASSGIDPPLPNNWVLRARYTYSPMYQDSIANPSHHPYALLKRSVSRRDSAGSESANDDQLYRYRVALASSVNRFRLEQVYDNETVQSIVGAMRHVQNDPTIGAYDLLDIDDSTLVPFIDAERSDCIPCVQENAPNENCEQALYDDCAENAIRSAQMKSLADVAFREDQNVCTGANTTVCDAILSFGGIGNSSDAFIRVNSKERMEFRRTNGERNGTFEYYFFTRGILDTVTGKQPSRYHYPYRHFVFKQGWVNNPLDETLWIAVIDEIDTGGGTGYDPAQTEGMISRRIVEMNPAGFVLRDRTWEFTVDAGGILIVQSGYGEQKIYDCWGNGKLVEERTKGWDATDPVAQGSEGLIYVYEYEGQELCPVDCTLECELGELRAVGVKKGADGAVTWIANYDHAVPERPELVTSETSRPEAGGPGVTTTFNYAFGPADDPDWTGPLTYKLGIGPGAPITDGGPAVFTVEESVFNDCGNEIRRGVGISSDKDGKNPIEMHVNIVEYNDKGQKTLEVVDADLPPYSVSTPGVEPLNLTTRYEYDPVFGLTKIIFPNGRQRWVEYIQDQDAIEQWVYPDVRITDGSFVANAPVQITRLEGSRVVFTKQVNLLSNSLPPHDDTDVEEITTATPSYDVNGRLSGLGWSQGEASDPSEFSVSSKISYNGFGQIARVEEADGSITRNIYNERGFLTHVFRGSKDIHEIWGNAPPAMPDPGPCDQQFVNNDDLVLVEKRYYGSGSTDADLLTRVRSYRNKPDNQYDEIIPQICGIPNVDNNEDLIGRLELHQYDWRMRDVWVEQVNEAGAALSHSLTWYDNLDRMRFVAEYGANAPAAGSVGDPRALGATSTLPTAVQIISDNCGPDCLMSLVENVYNRRGQVEEVRQYQIDPNVPGAFAYTTTKRFYNYGDQPVEVLASNAPKQLFKYDGKNRQIESSAWASDNTEITRTQTVYDEDDRVTQTTRWERRERSLGPLDDTNSVKTYSFSWYDSSGRLIATADFGTNSTDFTTGSAPTYFGDQPPALFSNDVLVGCNGNGYTGETRTTCYEYDEAERITAVIHPDGSVTRSEYDHLGRLVLKTENADGRPSNITAYQYDNQGRLAKIAAVLPDQGVVTPGAPVPLDWDAVDGTMQITELRYGASVVADGDPSQTLSTNNSWVSSVTFPDPDFEQQTTNSMERSLAFSYYMDGSVASRTDARGNKFTYDYDDLSRLASLFVSSVPVLQGGTSTWYGADTLVPPTDMIDEILYEYESDGMLAGVTARSGGSVIAQNQFGYDKLNNLLGEFQAHGGLVDASTPGIRYTWDYKPHDLGNYNRLSSMTYPLRADRPIQRSLSFTYGDRPGGPGDALNRISAIADSELGFISHYEYAGTGRRVITDWGNGVQQSVVGAGGFTGLDRFGRVTDLQYRTSTGTRQRFQYGYDKAGNRTFALTTQLTSDGLGSQTDRSWLYGYDELNRLISAEVGQLNATNDAINQSQFYPSQAWTLDNLGNWSGTESVPGLALSGSSTLATTHAVDNANQITQLQDNTGKVTDFVYDAVGNLVDDGQYFYQYDAWNRLVQVNAYGATDPKYILDGSGRPEKTVILGPTLAHYHYDGLGRLIKDDADVNATVDYYYDGVRRIQEHKVVNGRPLVREYMYGPGYVDEYVCRVDENLAVNYVAQDANYNVVALFDALGEVVAQFAWNPYGTLVASESFAQHADLRIGHQGLFFTRFDGTTVDPTIAADASGLYYNRNRHYNPTLGRFMQRDPNETAIPIATAILMNAASHSIFSPTSSIEALYGSGFNLYGYVNSNPLRGRDPLGLEDPFAEIDEIIFEMQAEKAAQAQVAYDFGLGVAKGAATMALTVAFAAVVPHGALIVAAWGATTSLDDILTRGFTYGNVAGLGLSIAGVRTGAGGFRAGFGRLGGGIRNLLGKFRSRFNSVRAAFKPRNGRAGSRISAARGGACFVAGTLVLMQGGSVLPIEQVQLGQRVESIRDPEFQGSSSVESESRDWVHLDFVLDTERNGQVLISLLRPRDWLEAKTVHQDSKVFINLPEMGISGWASLASVEVFTAHYDWPAAGTVTGTFRTEQAETVGLILSDLDQPLVATANHPVYSDDHEMWVPIGNLETGESVRTRYGCSTVESVVQPEHEQTVFNIEVHGDHTYFVSDGALWVHNACPLGRGSTGRTAPSNLKEQLAMEQAMANPSAGRMLNRVTMNDNRWLGTSGWDKYAQNINGIEIHYVLNRLTGAVDDFKFK